MFGKLLAVVGAALLLSGCGGGGNNASSTAAPTPTPAPTPTLTNFTSVVVDAGPTSITTGANAVTEANLPYVSVTLCAPGTTTCQTIDHIQVDTGSVGLRVVASVLSPSLLAALPAQTDPAGSPVGECFQYIDGYVFGSVRQADFQIGGEKVANMPVQAVADSGQFATAPSQCSSGGGTNINTVQALAANGILGIGTDATDCGSYCTTAGGYAAAIYYDCPTAGCGAIIARAASTTAPFQQLPNPVAAMSVDNNGSVLSLPNPAAGGSLTLTGTLYFGIGTQTNNALGSATVLPTTTSLSQDGSGLITVTYKGQTLPDSFLDSGSNLYLFSDSTIAQCSGQDLAGFYCPASPLTITLTVQGVSGGSANPSFTLNNAQTLFTTSNAALPGLGGDPEGLSVTNAYPTSFDLGVPFFYGRSVYTAIEGRTAGSATGPFYAF